MARLKSFWGNSIRRFGSAIWGFHSGGVRAEEAWLAEANRNARLRSPIHTIASDVAVVDRMVQQLSESGKWEDITVFEPGSSAELLDSLIRRPHPRLTEFDVEYLCNYWIETVGRCGLRLIDVDEFGRPGELWPVPPHFFRKLPTPEEPFFTIRWWGESDDINVPAEEIIYFSNPDPTNPMLLSVGTAQSVDTEVNIDLAMSRFNDFYFKNFAMLGVILGIPGYDENKEEIDRAIEERRSGPENAFRTLIADSSVGNVTASNLAPALRDLNFQDGRKQTRDFIREGWQIPPERCGIIDNSNRSTIDGADYFQQSKNVLPRLKRRAQEYDLKLTPLFDDRNPRLAEWAKKKRVRLPRLRLWFTNPVTETAEHMLKVTTVGFRAGWMMLNEARMRHGLERVENGDVFFVPTNNVTPIVLGGDFTTIGQQRTGKPTQEAQDDGTE